MRNILIFLVKFNEIFVETSGYPSLYWFITWSRAGWFLTTRYSCRGAVVSIFTRGRLSPHNLSCPVLGTCVGVT